MVRVSFTAFLLGCALVYGADTPHVKPPSQIAEKVGAAPTDNTAEITLEKGIALALENSHQVKRASETLAAAEAALRKTRSSFFPTLSAEILAGTYHDRNPIPGDPSIPSIARDRNNYLAQLKISQSLFAGFRDSSAHAKGESARKIAETDLIIAKDETIQEVIQLYFGIQLTLKNLEAEREVEALRNQQLGEVRNRVAHGAATELAALQVEYSLKAQIPQLTALQSELESKRLRLARLMAVPLDQGFRLKSELPDDPRQTVSSLPPFSNAFDFALKNNPHFTKFEARLSELQNESGEILAKHLPSLDLLLNAGTNAYQRTDIASSDSLTYGAELKLTVPLFSGLSSLAERSERDSKLAALREERTAYREAFLENLNDAYRKLELAGLKLEAEKVNLQLTQKTVTKAKDLYRVGRATLTDILDGYSRFLEARKNASRAMFDRVEALFKIKSLLGLAVAQPEDSAGENHG